MSRDPYLEAKAEVETNITNVNNLLGSYRRIASASNDASSLRETAEELRSTVSVLEADLEDLEECVRVIEGHGDRWGIDPIEVGERRSFVNRVTGEVKRLRDKVHDAIGQPSGRTMEPYRDRHSDLERGNDAEETERWEREEQQLLQLLIRRQDDTLGVISGTLSSLASQAGLIGQEVHEHSEMLDDLSTRVDSTHSRLSRVSRTMQDFIRKNEDSRSSWCIGILILVLIILFIAVILV